jgi:hypothetical protein
MSRSDVLLQSITEFYDDPAHFDLLKNILEKKSGVSLRNLEWFITDYSKKKNIAYKTKTGRLFSVHMSYKSSLDGCGDFALRNRLRDLFSQTRRRRYSKKLFDPFCRTAKIEFKGLHTTVAQLNFIRWYCTRFHKVSDSFSQSPSSAGASRTTSSRQPRWPSRRPTPQTVA